MAPSLLRTPATHGWHGSHKCPEQRCLCSPYFCIWWARAVGTEVRVHVHCENPAWEGRTKDGGGVWWKGSKVTKEAGSPEPMEVRGPGFRLSSREPIYLHALLVTHRCFPWTLVPGWTGSRVTHNKQQRAEGWLGIWHLFFGPSVKLLSSRHRGW